ncbi:hypothetical protein [Carboxydothermus hydrogenoformans]|nr:hypothetical protein [Carboxydothermus hydrogenoformans]
MGTDPLMENYLALAVSILANASPELAFEYLDKGKPIGWRKRKDITEEDVLDMVKLKNEHRLTYKQIAEIYGMSKDAIRHRIQRYSKRIWRRQDDKAAGQPGPTA